jgi:transcriptional regulator of acetoin/glycerol metabolism
VPPPAQAKVCHAFLKTVVIVSLILGALRLIRRIVLRAAHVVQGSVGRDAVDPSGQTRLAAKMGQGFVDPKHHSLGEILRLTLTGQSSQIPKNPRPKGIVNRLLQHDGQITRTAEALGISRKNLWERMRRLGLSQSKTEPPLAN